MPRLDDTTKHFIVAELASFRTPSEVVDAVREQFGLNVSRQAVETYNPYRLAGRKLAQKWREIFDATRKAYLDDTARHGVAHRAYRLERLQRLIDNSTFAKSPMIQLQVLSQAAQEASDAELEQRLQRLEERLR